MLSVYLAGIRFCIFICYNNANKLERYNGGNLLLKAIIFDKDGTLIDLGTSWDKPSIEVTENLLQYAEIDSAEKEAFKRYMGIEGDHIKPNSILATQSIREVAKEFSQIIPNSAAELEEEMEEVFLEYISKSPQSTELLPGVVEMLDYLKEQYILGIVTNDNYRLAIATLDQVNLLDYFDFIACSDEYGSKPNPAALHEISRRFDIKLSEMMYVGDSEIDMQYGKHTKAAVGYANMPSHRAFLHKADFIIDDFKQLIPLIESIEEEN